MEDRKLIHQNRDSWNVIADDWFGNTALPIYGRSVPSEYELQLFGNISDKVVLDIGCGSGHSLMYQGKSGAKELWGLDLSKKQIENAEKLLLSEGYNANLFVSPMEDDPSILHLSF